jgi:ribose/xylose/arabinose/galactoside ABC-type transport system permease subunit
MNVSNLKTDVTPALPATEASMRLARPAESRRARALDLALRYGMLIVLLVLVVVAELVFHQFLTVTNLQNLVIQNASTAIVAIGMTFVIISGGFDLSVGGSFAIGSVLFAKFAVGGTPIIISLGLALAAGLACGLVNGLVITKLRVNTFVATLGTGAAFTGAAALLSHSAPISAFIPGFSTLGAGHIAGVGIPVVLVVVLFLLSGFTLSRTVFGRSLFATGGNREAARLAGLRVDRVQVVAFLIAGVLAALAGAVLASILSTGQFDQDTTVALDSIAAVVIGGTSLYGGEGAMWRTAVGVAILATMNNLFSSLAIATSTQSVIKGLVVVLAVAFEELARRIRQ